MSARKRPRLLAVLSEELAQAQEAWRMRYIKVVTPACVREDEAALIPLVDEVLPRNASDAPIVRIGETVW